MAYHIGDCPECGARLLIEYKDANKYDDLDLTESYINITYIAECWKCGAHVEATICSNIEEQPMEIHVIKNQKLAKGIKEALKDRPDLSEAVPYSFLKTRNLTEAEAMEEKAGKWKIMTFCAFGENFCESCKKKQYVDLVIREKRTPSNQLKGRIKVVQEADLICNICKYPTKATHTVIFHD